MENSPFAKLSEELRDIIYAYALPDVLDVLEISSGYARPKISITQLCSQMREEAYRTLTTPYKLSIEATRVQGFSISSLVSFETLLKERIAAFQQLPQLFHSKPTTIHCHAMLWTTNVSDLRSWYEQHGSWWIRVRKTVQHFIQETQAHRLVFAFEYHYIRWCLLVPDGRMKCTRQGSVGVVSALHWEMVAGGDHQAAKRALSKAVAEQREAINMHDSANQCDLASCSIMMERDELKRELEGSEAKIKLFLELLCE